MAYYKTKKIVIVLLLHTFLLSVALSCIFPFMWMINVSLKTSAEFEADSGLQLANSVNLDNYKTILFKEKKDTNETKSIANSIKNSFKYLSESVNDATFLRYFLNSVFYTFTTVFFIVLISSLAAYGFSRLNFPFKNLIFYMFLGAMMVPLPAGFVPVYVLLNKLGLVNRVGYILAMTNMGLSLSIYILKTFFDQLPHDLEDAARIDGCSKLQIWRHVLLPLVWPALAVVIIFNSLNVWNEFVFASLIFTDSSLMPLQVGLMEFADSMVTQHTLIMAALTIAALPIMLLYLKMQKQFVKGITAGAMVG
jgi:ABC-type glycerol-3-phosphate transport system permease component